MIMNRLVFILLAITTLSLSGCKKDNGGGSDGTDNPRTIFVYMGGDNNLSTETYEKIDALCSAFSSSEINGKMIIYQDARLGGFREAYLYQVARTSSGQYVASEIKRYGEADSADPTTLSTAIADAVAAAPAKSYGMIVFSHGSGWLPADQSELSSTNVGQSMTAPSATSAGADKRSIITDGNNSMSITDFAAAIPANTFDFIVMEACLMGDITTIYELSDKTNKILASPAEIVSPGFTDIYPQCVAYLYQETPDLEAFGRAYMNYWLSQTNYPYATIALYDCTKMQALVDAVIDPISSTPNLGSDGYIDYVQRFGRLQYRRCFLDLIDYTHQFSTTEQMDRISTAIKDVVLYKAATKTFGQNLSGGDGFDIISYCGMAIYPEPWNYSYINQVHRTTTKFGKALQKAVIDKL